MPSEHNPDIENPVDYELLLPSEQAGQYKPPMGREEQFTKKEGRKGDAIAIYGALGGAIFLLVITWILVLSNHPWTVGWFALHPLLQTLAVSSFTYGILTLQPTSQPKTKAAGLTRHQVAMLFIGFPSILIGSFAVMYNKWLRGADHLVTWHGVFGTISLLWILIQVALGGGSVWFGGAAFGGGAKAKAVWKYHRLSGYILLPLLLLTVHLGGGWSAWSGRHAGLGLRLFAYTVVPAAILLSVYVRVRVSKMNFSQ